LEQVREHGPREAYRRLIEENNRQISGAELDNGRALVRARTAIHTALIGEWAAAQRQRLGYDKPFAVVALGGTGRGELTPCSDLDIAFLFDDALEENPFLLELQRQTLHTDAFLDQYGFSFIALPFGLDDLPELAEKQLNSFIDMSPVYDPQGLARLFRERIRLTFDPFEHFLHVRGFWKTHWAAAAAGSESLKRFDIKNDGLRLFLGGVWTLGGKDFRHSHEVYQELPDPRDLEAYEFLLRIRAWVHLRREPARATLVGNHAEDVLGFEDFCSFGEMLGTGAGESEQFEFATAVRARLLSARRRVAVFARGVIERELRYGRRVPPEAGGIVLKAGGLQHSRAQQVTTPEAKSRAALSMLLAAQHYGVPIDSSELQTTFCNLGDWLVRVPELSELFYETRGSLADTIEYLTQLDGAAERLFPGYGRFEASLDERVMIEQTSLRGAWVREKLRALDSCLVHGNARLNTRAGWNPRAAELREMVAHEAALLDADHLAAVKLALLTKRLPFTPDDAVARTAAGLALHEREASGFSRIPLAEYYLPYVTEAGFSQETARVAEFLVTHRRLLKLCAESGPNDRAQVEGLVRVCGDEMMLRALFVFSCMDRLMGVPAEMAALNEASQRDWWVKEADPARWFNIRELYVKALGEYHPELVPDPDHALRSAGYVPEELAILRDFGADFFGGLYGRHALTFGSHLLRLVDDPEVGAKAALLRESGAILLGLAARDFRGLAACISGALWKHQINLRQAHLFCATNHQLALDFFHVAPGGDAIPAALPRLIEHSISNHLHISDADEALLPPLDSRPTLDVTPAGNYRLRYETTSDTGGLIYALSFKVFRHLEGAIHCLTATTARGRAYITVILSLPPGRSLEEARAIIARFF
jgi:hypothetical protein